MCIRDRGNLVCGANRQGFHSTGLQLERDCGTVEYHEDVYKRQLFEFPLKEIAFSMPKWVTMLDRGHWLQEAVYTAVQELSLIHI